MNALALAPPRAILAELDARQPHLARFGWAMLGLTLACLAAMAFAGRTINGPSVGVKPASFACSCVAWTWTLAWAWGVLAPSAREGLAARLVLSGTLAAAGYEQGWITLRAALGLPSHFGMDARGGAMYSLMGVGGVVLVAAAALLGLLVLLRGDPAQPRPWRLAVGLGLVIGGVLGGISGASISALDTPKIGGTAADARNLAPFFWSRDGGDLRVAHFLSIHAMQALPVLALLGAGAGVVWAGAAGWTALSVAAYALAMAGVPLAP